MRARGSTGDDVTQRDRPDLTRRCSPTSPGTVPAAAITPSDLAVVTSPLTINGAALAFEGGVNVRVAQVSNGKVRQFGTGHVTGGGDVMRPFTGQIRFAAPSTDIGWVLATELSAYDGAVTKVIAVRVAFTPLGS